MRQDLRNVLLGAVLAAGSLASACTPPAELDTEDLEPTFGWDELVLIPGGRPELQGGELPLAAHTPTVGANAQHLAPERLAALPETLKREPELARLALTRGLENPTHWRDGVYGTVGPVKFYVTTTEAIPDEDRLYPVMIALLSEKYGCFIKGRVKSATSTLMRCRDNRQIVFWRGRGPGWVQFYARQYDADGYEIVVKNRRIVRISKERRI
jgi:hypothetical protein